MRKVKEIFFKRSGVLITSLALVLAVSSANAACFFCFHQPKEPQGMAKFKRR